MIVQLDLAQNHPVQEFGQLSCMSYDCNWEGRVDHLEKDSKNEKDTFSVFDIVCALQRKVQTSSVLCF